MGNVTLFWLSFSCFLMWLLTRPGVQFEDSIRVVLIGLFFACCIQTLISGILWYAERLQPGGNFIVIEKEKELKGDYGKTT